MHRIEQPAKKSDAIWKRDISSSVLTKILLMPIAALVGLMSLRTVTQDYGYQGLALYGLVISIPLLLPFADLGIGGSVTEVVASRATQPYELLRSTLIRALITLVIAATLIIVIAALLYWADIWPSLIGVSGAEASTSAMIVMALFGLTVPFSLGYRILLGLQLNRIVVFMQSISGIVGAVGVILISGTVPLPMIIALPSIAGLVVSVIACTLAMMKLSSDGIIGSSTRDDLVPPRLRSLAGPMLIISISVPIIFQAHRLVLAHLGMTLELAAYTTAVQLYFPANALLTAAGQSLWPRFSSLRNTSAESSFILVLKSMLLFVSAAALIGVFLTILGPHISSWITDDGATASRYLFLSFSVLLVINSANYPVAMSMMGQGAVLFQACCSFASAVASLALMAILGSTYGSVGVVAATCIAVLIFSVIPCLYYSWRTSEGIKDEATNR